MGGTDLKDAEDQLSPGGGSVRLFPLDSLLSSPLQVPGGRRKDCGELQPEF
jgi:hypothetical protein